jgi:F420-dependent oxidoreductase-like protein
MEFRIFTEPQQGAGYQRLSTLAMHTETLGFDGFFVSDHYHAMGEINPRLGPTDALTTLAGLARDTNSLRLGTLVCSSTFRQPGRLAVIAAEVDQMSSGRLELGVGAGWFDREHEALGIDFPPLKERFDRMEDQLSILELFRTTPSTSTFSYEGKTASLKDCPALPKASQKSGIPIIVGGGGPKRTPNLAARFASEFNLPFSSPTDFQLQAERVARACESLERDPESMIFSSAQVLCIGESEEELIKRSQRIGRELSELRENGVAGILDEARERIRAFQQMGVSRMYFQVLDEDDLDHVTLLAELLDEFNEVEGNV